MRLIRFKWLNLIKQVNRKLINGINWKTPKYEEIIGRRISPLHAGNTFCCIYVHLYISYANLFLCFYNMIWDIIFRTTFKVIWYRAWSNWARTHYIWIDCWYLARVLGPWDPIFGSYNNTRCWLMQRLFCSDIGHYTREDTNPVFPVVQELQFSSAIGESNKLVLNIILGIFTSVMVCRNTFLDD